MIPYYDIICIFEYERFYFKPTMIRLKRLYMIKRYTGKIQYYNGMVLHIFSGRGS